MLPLFPGVRTGIQSALHLARNGLGAAFGSLYANLMPAKGAHVINGFQRHFIDLFEAHEWPKRWLNAVPACDTRALQQWIWGNAKQPVAKIGETVRSAGDRITGAFERIKTQAVQRMHGTRETLLDRAYSAVFSFLPWPNPRAMTITQVLLALLASYWAYLAMMFYLRLGKRVLQMVLTAHFPTNTEPVYPNKCSTELDDLTVTLPPKRKRELLTRIATHPDPNRATVIDIVRRVMAEEHWSTSWTKGEFEAFLERVCREPAGTANVPPLAAAPRCVNCNRAIGHKKRRECRDCLYFRMHIGNDALWSRVYPSGISFFGVQGLWSRKFQMPDVELKETTKIVIKMPGRGSVTMTQGKEVKTWFTKKAQTLTCRGKSCGPTFLSMRPGCFSRDPHVAVATFCCRLGLARVHEPSPRMFRLLFKFVQPFVEVLQPHSKAAFLSKFTGLPREVMESAMRDDGEGWTPTVDHVYQEGVKMKGFVKSEKSYSFTYRAGILMDRSGLKPRYICAPDKIHLFHLGRYTHVQTKWLHRRFGPTKRMYYAGCSAPEQLNKWCKWTREQLGEFVTLIDDISSMDAGHSTCSFDFHAKVRAIQFPHMSEFIEALFRAQENVRARTAMYVCMVEAVNASGVSDTSYKNSMLCLFIRVLCITMAIVDTTYFTNDQFIEAVHAVLGYIFTAAAGDDGITRMPPNVMGVDVMSPGFLQRYEAAWAQFGFGVKAAMMPAHRWRMATFLGMRPVWGGKEYIWAPEPARRLRGMYWMIDKDHHPISWGRGISRQITAVALHVPILGDIAQWYLDKTKGPAIDLDKHQGDLDPDDEYKMWTRGETGIPNERADLEFCQDYAVSKAELDVFRLTLKHTNNVLVNISLPIIHRLYAEES